MLPIVLEAVSNDGNSYSGGDIIGRPRKNRGKLIGRAGRIAIELEDLARDAQRWQRRRAHLKNL
jgi:hypothetical protein